MRFLILATDYDGTLAEQGKVDETVWPAIRRLRESGRRVIMVTGRELEDLQAVCPSLDLFDRVVAENGALIYDPKTRETRVLCEPPPPRFAARLAALGVTPISVGRVIVATVKPFESAVLNAINELGLELQVIFNQESVMVLPTGVNKATGLAVALKELGCSPHNVVAIGDAENDHALLSACECGVAVGNAVPALKERADFVAASGPGQSVIELIDQMLDDDLRTIAARISRHDVVLGAQPEGGEARLTPYGVNILIAGQSGAGKTVVASGLLERMMDSRYQCLVFDPEGDYSAQTNAVVLGSPEQPPQPDEVLSLLAAGRNSVVNLLGVPLSDRPKFFAQLFPKVLALRCRVGRPHWILIDEAHHLWPPAWVPPSDGISERLHNTMMITVAPANVAPRMLANVDLLVALGPEASATLANFCRMRQQPVPATNAEDFQSGEALAYWVGRDLPPFKIVTVPPRSELRRHRRKYAEGRLPDERSFMFRGPKGRLRLRAHNLMTFLELADGVDDATFLHHLRARDYSQWFREAIKDDDLAFAAEAIETRYIKDAASAREQLRKTVEQRYTLPAQAPSGSA